MLKLFKRTWCVLMLLPLLALNVQAEEYKEGVHYSTLPQPVRTQDPSKVEVVEMFGYWCPHCNHFERYVEPWRKQQPDYVDFRPIPVVFRPNQTEAAKAYYVAKALGVEEEIHPMMFNQYHRLRQPVTSKEQLAEVFASIGVSADDFEKAYGSFAVNSQMGLGRKKAKEYHITGVPSMIVNGKYLVTAEQAGSQEAMLKVVEFLINKEKAAL